MWGQASARETISAAAAVSFVRSVYAGYGSGRQTFDSSSKYSPTLKRLFSINSRLLGGEVGENNDIDQVCQCQDWDHFRLLSTRATQVGSAASVKVVFFNDGVRTAQVLKLLKLHGGWVIDDIVPADGGPGFQQRLKTENLGLRQRAAGSLR